MEEMLERSVEQYQQIIDHIHQLNVLLKDAEPAELHAYTTRLQQLQDAASRNDQQLIAQVTDNAEQFSEHPLFDERAQLLEEIVTMNRMLLPKIRGIMAVVASELAQIKSGRQAVAGYHRPLHSGRQAAREVG